MLSTVLSKHSLSDNYYYLQHNRESSYPNVFIWPLYPWSPFLSFLPQEHSPPLWSGLLGAKGQASTPPAEGPCPG